MKIYPKCIPCLMRRAYYEVDLADVEEDQRYEALKKALKSLNKNFSEKKATFEVSTEMHNAVYDSIEENDPYKEKKKLGNEIAQKIFPEINSLIKSSDESFKKSIMASIISNAFDFGVLEHDVDVDEISNTFPKEVEEGELGIDNVNEIKGEIKKAKEIAFVTDNCGEIVFDKLLIEEIRKISSAKLVLYVRGEPIFNDATIKEAEEVNIASKADEVKELGERAVGVHPDYLNKEVKEDLFNSDLIISKGMANYESFSEIDDGLNIAYVFKTKCGPVANSIGAEVGDNIAYLNSKN